jgi:hypothetical protein
VLAHLRQLADDTLAANAMRNTQLSLLTYVGDWRELARAIDSIPAEHQSSYTLGLRGLASAMLGDTADARRRSEAMRLGTGAGVSLARARILAAIGDKDAALALLKTRDAPVYYWQYHGDVIYRLMRDYPRFQEALKPRD